MKIIKFFSPRTKNLAKTFFIEITLVFFYCMFLLPLREVGSQSGDIYQKNVTDLEDFHLLSSDEGWILINQQIYWTKTGGSCWKNISPPGMKQSKIRAVFFLDTQHGWIILTNTDKDENVTYAIARTFDSGNTWLIKTLSLFELGDVNSFAEAVYLYFIDADIGWLVIKQATSSNFCVGTLFKTTDGGNTWTQLSIPIGEPVYFVTSELGWTAGGAAGDKFYRTVDGGKNWHPQKIVRPLLNNKIQRELYQIPKFVNAREGVLPVVTNDGKTTEVEFYVTVDSGQSWSLKTHFPVEREISSRAIPLTVFDTKRWMMVVPNSNRLMRKSNGSEVMAEISQDPMTAGITELNMVTPNEGWAKYASGSCAPVPRTSNTSPLPQAATCTQETRLLKTNNGGMTWKVLKLPKN